MLSNSLASWPFLWSTYLDDQVATRLQELLRPRHEALEYRVPTWSAVQGEMRLIVLHADRKCFHVLASDIGRIAENKVEAGAIFHCCEHVALQEFNTIRNFVTFRILLRELQRFRA